jgi:PhnB protein
MLNTTPYLHFKGQAEEAMNFYKAVLGGEFSGFQRYKDVPGGEKMAAPDKDRLIHIALQVSPFITIMASDMMQSAEDECASGNNYHICIHTESEPETQNLFEGLSRGGQIEMPLNKTFWGAYFGMCRDKFGIHWMLNYTPGGK